MSKRTNQFIALSHDFTHLSKSPKSQHVVELVVVHHGGATLMTGWKFSGYLLFAGDHKRSAPGWRELGIFTWDLNHVAPNVTFWFHWFRNWRRYVDFTGRANQKTVDLSDGCERKWESEILSDGPWPAKEGGSGRDTTTVGFQNRGLDSQAGVWCTWRTAEKDRIQTLGGNWNKWLRKPYLLFLGLGCRRLFVGIRRASAMPRSTRIRNKYECVSYLKLMGNLCR